MKILSFGVPCYNSEGYMKKCIDSLLTGGEDIEIIIVDDGSKDGTAAIADEYAEAYPDIVKVVHQENGGHGEAVNAGLRNASGLYYKVVDSDDWLDEDSLKKVIEVLKGFAQNKKRVDLMICNYVYEHVEDGKAIRYANVLPENQVFGWNQVGRFRVDQNLLMHTMIYRTKVLREAGLELPKHTFYVDNLFAYIPLPYVRSLYYMNVDLYRYYIGRSDQSVNESVMISRIDQQILVNKLMFDAYSLPDDVFNKRLSQYMMSYLAMISLVTSIMLTISGTEENKAKRKELWRYFKENDYGMYLRLRLGARGVVSNPPGVVSSSIARRGYHLAQKIYKFN
jgi:glycosyltransferase involved in cell wall biosynthesis